jgi:L-carnitine CoA-transferase
MKGDTTVWKNKNLPDFGCLNDIKIVHATQSTAGPFGVQLLADFGADVLWIENALAPDITRFSGDVAIETQRVNSRNLSLNVPSEEGREVFFKVLKDADVFIEASKGGQWAKWGLDDEKLWEVNPRLIIVHVSGYGQTGLPDYVSRPSYDAIAQAFGGLIDMNRNPETAPYAIGPYQADFTTALYIPIAVMFALHKVRQTGIGESIDIAQFEVIARTQQHQEDWFTRKIKKDPAGFPSVMAGWGCYQCKDGSYIQCCIIGGGVLKKAIPFFGFEYGSELFPGGMQLVHRDMFPAAYEAFLGAILKFCADRTGDEAAAAMLAAGLPVSKCNTYEDLENDPHVQLREDIEEWEAFTGEKIRSFGIVPKFKNYPGKRWRPSPWQGMDNEDILSELGYSSEEIQAFYDKKVITRNPGKRIDE